MNKEIKAKWVAALRSGNYKQGHGSLYEKRDNSFCCLGVCSAIVSGKNPRKGSNYLSHNRFGLTNKIQIALSELNDEGLTNATKDNFVLAGFKSAPRGRNFNSIASWIEKNL